MRPDPRAEGRRWLDQSLHDLDDARFARDGGRHNLACFLCQQAAEKALKGFLVMNGVEAPWGHSVFDLCERAAAFDAAFRELAENGGSLDVYYIPTRYPNGLPGGLPSNAFHDEDAARATEKATTIIDVVRRAFEAEPEEGPGTGEEERSNDGDQSD